MKKRVITKYYEINSKKKINKDIVILLFSDIHYNDLISSDSLDKIKDSVNDINPDYICIPGDVIDSLVYIENESLMNLFYLWLNNLNKINEKEIPILISLGNHDMTYYSRDKRNDNDDVNVEFLFQKYYNDMNSINKNIYLLDNEIYEDDKVFIAGITEPLDYFYSANEKELFESYLKNMDKKILYPKSNKFNIALIHSPINITDECISKYFIKYDLILSGHMHNGLFLPIMDKFIKGNNGIISPNKKWFPKVARGMLEIDKDRNLIISGGITKLSSSSGIFHYGNIIYPMNIEKVKIKLKKY